MEIYTRGQDEGCEEGLFCLWLVFYPPAVFALTYRRLLVFKDCRLTKCSDDSVILFLYPPRPHSVHMYVFQWLM